MSAQSVGRGVGFVVDRQGEEGCGGDSGGDGVLEDPATDLATGVEVERRLRVMGWSPLCLTLFEFIVFICASLLMAALQVLPRQRQEISPFFKTLYCLYL